MEPQPSAPASAVPDPPLGRTASSPQQPMCYHCGQILQGTEEKCPSCGAPTRTLRRGKRPGSMTVAAFLLFGLALIGGLMGGVNLSNVDSVLLDTGIVPSNDDVVGTVSDANGSRVVGALVRLDRVNRTTTTDANGTFRFDDVGTGGHILTISTGNQTRFETRFVALGAPVDVEARLGGAGETLRTSEPEYRTATTIVRSLAIAVILFSLLILWAGVACLRLKQRGLAITGGILGLILAPVVYLPAFLVALIALVIIIRNRRAFA